MVLPTMAQIMALLTAAQFIAPMIILVIVAVVAIAPVMRSRSASARSTGLEEPRVGRLRLQDRFRGFRRVAASVGIDLDAPFREPFYTARNYIKNIS